MQQLWPVARIHQLSPDLERSLSLRNSPPPAGQCTQPESPAFPEAPAQPGSLTPTPAQPGSPLTTLGQPSSFHSTPGQPGSHHPTLGQPSSRSRSLGQPSSLLRTPAQPGSPHSTLAQPSSLTRSLASRFQLLQRIPAIPEGNLTFTSPGLASSATELGQSLGAQGIYDVTPTPSSHPMSLDRTSCLIRTSAQPVSPPSTPAQSGSLTRSPASRFKTLQRSPDLPARSLAFPAPCQSPASPKLGQRLAERITNHTQTLGQPSSQTRSLGQPSCLL